MHADLVVKGQFTVKVKLVSFISPSKGMLMGDLLIKGNSSIHFLV